MKQLPVLQGIFFAVGVLVCISPGVATGQERPVLERRKLDHPTLIDGIPCGRTPHARFYRSGRLASCPLAEPTEIAEHLLPAKTWVHLAEDGRLESVWLPQDTYLAGHLCRGTGNQGWSVIFYPTGALKLCFLGKEEVIDGIPCLKGTFLNELRGGGRSAVLFREDGRLEQCQASRDFTRNGVEAKKWSVVLLDPSGRMRVE